MNGLPHLQFETVEKYILQSLPEIQVIHVEKHLILCHKCRERIEEFEVFRAGVREASIENTDGETITMSAGGRA
jgi:hypothetical protein